MNTEEIRLCGLKHPKVLGEPKCRICGREYWANLSVGFVEENIMGQVEVVLNEDE